MALLKQLRQNITSLQNLFKKRRRSGSVTPTSHTAPQDEGSNPDRNPTYGNQHTQGQNLATHPPTTTIATTTTGRLSSSVDQSVSPPPSASSTTRDKGRNRDSPNPTQPESDANPTSSLESDSELEVDGSISRCQCSGRSPRTSGRYGFSPCQHLAAEDFYGERKATGPLSKRAYVIFPSTSQQRRWSRDGGGFVSDAAHSSCSQEELLVEEMLTRLRTRGSLNTRRSRSRSRRSRARQSHETVPGAVVVNNVRVLRTFPRRETDSDDSNTSLADLPPPLPRRGRRNTPSCSNQSDSSFQSATAARGSDAVTSSRGSSISQKATAEEEEGEEEEAGEEGEMRREEEEREEGASQAEVNSTEHNRARNENPASIVAEELSPYGPEEFVLDLFFAMCRGTWSDILWHRGVQGIWSSVRSKELFHCTPVRWIENCRTTCLSITPKENYLSSSFRSKQNVTRWSVRMKDNYPCSWLQTKRDLGVCVWGGGGGGWGREGG